MLTAHHPQNKTTQMSLVKPDGNLDNVIVICQLLDQSCGNGSIVTNGTILVETCLQNPSSTTCEIRFQPMIAGGNYACNATTIEDWI
ncbi:unnamed protein product [Didymodactylos carnosus]|uniref:Uncharacterized protein n=1 Tax=Didymodactylos carnosus TaxID=1234261 RepID=A0A816CJ78_9BILA|nr:unnamed protein product [Didymodactylos carnosus]CAF4514107.1 unnamed protein product [Didymodactylos carnosus]